MNNSWNLKGDSNPYKKFDQAWSQDETKPAIAKEKTPLFNNSKPIQRSGVTSEANSLVTTSNYYKPADSAARGNTVG